MADGKESVKSAAQGFIESQAPGKKQNRLVSHGLLLSALHKFGTIIAHQNSEARLHIAKKGSICKTDPRCHYGNPNNSKKGRKKNENEKDGVRFGGNVFSGVVAGFGPG